MPVDVRANRILIHDFSRAYEKEHRSSTFRIRIPEPLLNARRYQDLKFVWHTRTHRDVTRIARWPDRWRHAESCRNGTKFAERSTVRLRADWHGWSRLNSVFALVQHGNSHTKGKSSSANTGGFWVYVAYANTWRHFVISKYKHWRRKIMVA